MITFTDIKLPEVNVRETKNKASTTTTTTAQKKKFQFQTAFIGDSINSVLVIFAILVCDHKTNKSNKWQNIEQERERTEKIKYIYI